MANFLRKYADGWLSILVFACLAALSQPAWAITYAHTATTFNWIDASAHTKLGPTTGGIYSPSYRFQNTGGCGTNPPVIDDTLTDNIPIGFTFMYGGQSFTQVRIMSNGRLQFNNNTTCGYGSPVTQLPYPNAGLDYTMRIDGGDLDPSLQSEIGGAYTTACTDRNICYVSYATIGTAPNRSFVVTWNNVPEWTSFTSTSGNYNLQVILQENGEFIYQYGNSTPGPGHTVGQIGWQVSNASGDYDVPAVGFPPAGTAIKFYIPRPVAEYRMEQPSWNGTPGEVLDTSGNGRHATAIVAGATTRPQDVAGGRVCRGGQIADNNSNAAISAIDTNIAVPTTVGNSGTISFWYNNSSNTRLLFDASVVNNRWFYLRRNNNRSLTFTVTDSGNTHRSVTTANNILPNTGWSHIVVSWTFNNLAGSNQDRLRIWVDGVLRQTSAFTTTNTISPQIGTLYLGDNRSNVSPIGRSAGNPGGMNATVDEFRIYNFEGGTALVNRDYTQTGACLSHYAISHAGTGQSCQTNNVTVTAHDASHNAIIMPNNTTQITLSTSTGQGDWTLVSGYGVLNNGTAGDGIATYLWNGEYQAVFALNHPTPGTVNINVSDGQISEGVGEDPNLVLSACLSKFNACHNHSTGQCSAASGRLYTRLAGVADTLDVVALDGAGNPATGFTGKAVVSLTANKTAGGALDANNCFVTTPDYTQLIDNAATAFTAGRLTKSGVIVPGAYRDARIKVVCDSTNCPPSGITACSVDNYAIRPQSFAVTANLGGPKLAAGGNFTIQADSGTTTYDGTPVLDTASMTDHNGAGIGTLNGTLPPAIAGVSTGTTFQYEDVGTITFSTDAVKDTTYSNVDSLPGDCVVGSTSNTLAGGQYGCNVGSSSSGPFGRFYPHHFTYTASLTPACAAGGFTYMGQPALGINLSLEARSANETVTERYTAGYAFLGSFSITGDNAGSSVDEKRLNPDLPSFVWNNGKYTVTSAVTSFDRNTSPDGPFDSFSLKANILTEPDGVTISGTNLSNTTKIRFGRLVLTNAHGSELLGLTMPIQTQYWTGSNWATNTLDSCTNVSSSLVFAKDPVSLPSPTGGAIGGGFGQLTFAAPNQKGTVKICANIGADGENPVAGCTAGTSLPWLQGSWDSGGAYDDNPWAMATFGVYQGRSSVIYRRERY